MEGRWLLFRVQDLQTPIIGPVSFDVDAGACVAITGPSGSGKSLLLRAIADLDPNQAEVSLGAQRRADMPAPEWRTIVAFVPAESGWWADRVGDHFPPDDKVVRLLAEVGLPDALDWDVSRLSTGERHRLAIARALCGEPQVLLLDEPTAALDEDATAKIEKLIRSRCDNGAAALLVTHDRRQAGRLASRSLTMSGGRFVEREGAAT